MVGESVDGGTTLLILFVPIIVSFNRIKAFALGVRFGAGFHSNYKSMLDQLSESNHCQELHLD